MINKANKSKEANHRDIFLILPGACPWMLRLGAHCHLRLFQKLKLNAIGRLIFLTGIFGLVHIY